MMKPLRLLIVEDSEDDAQLLLRELRRGGFEPTCERVQTAEAMRLSLSRQTWDLIVADYSMPRFSALEALDLVKQSGLDLPFLIVSGTIEEGVAVAAMKAGAHDYLLKGNLKRLVPAIERELREAEDRRKRQRAEASLRFQSQILDQVPAGVITTDLEGIITHWNTRAQELYGWSREEVLGKPLATLNLGTAEARFGTPVRRKVRSGVAWEGEMQVQRKNSTSFPAYVTVSLIRDEKGQQIGMVGITVDITDRKRAEEARRATEKRFRALIEHSWDAVSLIDAKGMITYTSPATTRVLGYTAEEFVGKNTFDLIRADDVLRARTLFDKLLAQPELSITDEIRFRHKDGSWRWLETTGTNLLHEPSVQAIVSNYRDVTERRSSEEALREAEEKYRSIFENAVEGIFQSTPGGRLLTVNPALARIYGYDSPEDLLANLRDLSRQLYVQPGRREEFVRILQEKGAIAGFESQVYRKDKSIVWVSESARVVRGTGGRALYYEGAVEDITPRKQAEEALRQVELQFRQAQKMEAVGRLAGGVAHDFNNMLTIITGYAEILLAKAAAGDPSRPLFEEIKRAAERSAALTRQLLAFSRRQVLAPKVLDLNAVVANLENMLRRLIGEDIQLFTELGPHLGRVRADESQIEQIIMNLAVNSRDAMPEGGKLIIETTNVELDQAYAGRHIAVRPGRYVLLAVSDTGCGMDPLTQSHIFEPFFTTKGVGQGTGLGLATVYGIVKQSEGNIWVYSEPGRGTTFKVYLPYVDEALSPREAPAKPVRKTHGTETVLLVEDEESVRSLARRVLEMNGYIVLEARQGSEAFQVCQTYTGSIDLLLTDVVMPGMTGCRLAELMAALRPAVKVLYLSGYPDTALAHQENLPSGSAFLQKPFTPNILAHKVRQVLDGQSGR